MKKFNKAHLKKLMIIMAVFIAAVLLFSACKKESGAIERADQLADPGRVIGVATDTVEGQMVEKLYPNARVEYYSDPMAPFVAVEKGKIDAFVFDKISMQTAITNGLTGVRLLDETLGEGNKSGVAISPVTKIEGFEEKINTFLREIKADGTIDEIRERWMNTKDAVMPKIDVPETSDIHLKVATSGSNMPFTYYAGTELAGYDIELAYRFAAWLGATIEFKIYDYEGIIAAAQTGDVDCIFANLFMTPERVEAIKFSEPTYVGDVGVLVRDQSSAAAKNVKDFAASQIAVLTGSNFPELVEKELPNAERVYFNSVTDMIAALQSDKVQAIAIDEPVARNIMAETANVGMAEGYLASFDYAYMFAKTDRGQKLRDELSEYISKVRKEGLITKLQEKWFDAVPEEEMMELNPDELSAQNGIINVATLPYPPFTMLGQKQFFGYEVELLSMFAKEKGYGLYITDMNADAIVPAVQSGKFDVGACGLSITEERREAVLFSEPDYSGGVVLLVKTGDGSIGSFIDSVKDSFQKTFIREGRYKLFLQGIIVTLIIAILSAIFGTVLGFLIFLACRRGNRVANFIARIFSWLMSGMPMVVLLMILYYVIFGNSNISGAAVSIIGFTLVFGAEVYGLMKTATGAVDKGQMEAAYSLGYTDNKAFFRHILPQAMPHYLPGYRVGIVNLIKGTSIVGYVAVQDLTKMADIVRSRTFDAFFPLIAVAIIYFILGALLVFLVNRITLRVDPTRRSEEDILKGIKTHD